jgi:coenzyme F420-reducing hydrogenase beta subunit
MAYIGYALNENIRFTATSGGIGSALLAYFFDFNLINSCVSYEQDESTLLYNPKIVYNFADYRITGSIYHEIDLYKYLKENIQQIKGPFCCFALPCQVRPIKNLLKKNSIDNIVIGLTCSSQQSMDATLLLLKFLNTKRDNVTSLTYRGNGWPSGIEICLKNGHNIIVPNNDSLWTKIFHSRLFIHKKCFFCNDTLNIHSDISLADPWLQRFIEKEKIGQTIFQINSSQFINTIQKAEQQGYIKYSPLSDEDLNSSQHDTIRRKQSYKRHKNMVLLLRKMYVSSLYKNIVTSNIHLFNIHCALKNRIEQILRKI